MHISKIYFGMKFYILNSKFYISSRSICSCSKAVYKPVWHIPLLSVQWINSRWWTDELSEINFEISGSSWFYYKEICYDAARSHESKKVWYYVATFNLESIRDTKQLHFRTFLTWSKNRFLHSSNLKSVQSIRCMKDRHSRFLACVRWPY
jgi:hypothetical protein